jgi:tRNA pseudouridine55 synthase
MTKEYCQLTQPAHGLLLLDKPVGMTSREAVDRAACWFPPRTRIGHTGTLDRLASGLLVICLGHATRLTEYVQRMKKRYSARLTLGARSETDDAEGPITAVENCVPPAAAELEAALAAFIGQVAQVPPGYSAVKLGGERAHVLARKGILSIIEARMVEIDCIEVGDYRYPDLGLEIVCGKGTYIRSLARDLGERLGCGAYVKALRRLRVGPFSVDDALSVDANGNTAILHLRPLEEAVVELPVIRVSNEIAARLRHGQRIRHEESIPEAEAAVFGPDSALVAVVRISEDMLLQPNRVIPA